MLICRRPPKYQTDKKIGIGVVNHCITTAEPPEHVTAHIRIVRRELDLPEAHIRAADPKLYFANADES